MISRRSVSGSQTLPLLPFASLLFGLSFLRLFTLVSAADVSVDDNDSSISYSPSDSWQEGRGCTSCALSPDPGSAHGGTWHDMTYYPGGSARTISFTFTGTGISAYFIVPDKPQGSASVDTSLTFALDGSQAGSYSHTVSGSSDFLYNQQVFSKSGLSNGEHTIVISANADTGGGSTVMLFDYFVYTTEDGRSTTAAALATTSPSPTSPSSSPGSLNTASTAPTSGSSDENNGSTRIITVSGSLSTVTTGGTVSPGASALASVTGDPSSDSLIGTGGVSPSPSESSGNNTTSFSDVASNSSSHTNVGAVVGGAVGGILGLILLCLLLLCWRRKRRQAEASVDVMRWQESSADGEGSHGRSWFCLRDSDPMLASHPVVFAEETLSSQTENMRSYKNSPMQNLVTTAPYNVKDRPFTRMNAVDRSGAAPNRRASSDVQAQVQTLDGSGLSTIAILSQVAAIQAAVLSLQEQRMQESSAGPAAAPPAYSSRNP